MPSRHKTGSNPERSRALPDKRVLILDDPSAEMDTLKSHFGRFEHGQRYTLHTASNGGEAAAVLPGAVA